MLGAYLQFKPQQGECFACPDIFLADCKENQGFQEVLCAAECTAECRKLRGSRVTADSAIFHLTPPVSSADAVFFSRPALSPRSTYMWDLRKGQAPSPALTEISPVTPNPESSCSFILTETQATKVSSHILLFLFL